MSGDTIEIRRRDDGVAVLVCGHTPLFERATSRLREDPEVRAIVLMSRERDFVAGIEPRRLQGVSTQSEGEARARADHAALGRLASLSKPVVAAVHGRVMGRGLEIALACDARIASDAEDTAFALPEVKMGLMPGAHGLQRLADVVGLKAALHYGLTGETMDVRTAARLGLVDAAVARENLEDVAARRALELARSGATPRVVQTSPSWPARQLLLRRARAEARSRLGAHFRGPERIVDVLALHAARGLAESRDEEARAVGELLVSTTARRLLELWATIGELTGDASIPAVLEDLDRPRESLRTLITEAQPMLEPALREAAGISREGVPGELVDACLREWGWQRDSAAAKPLDPKVPLAVPCEEIQMRFALQLVNQALRSLGEGSLRGPREGDVGAVLGLGFPAFRGGPFRYVDAVGAAEVLRRIETYRSRHGERWAPAPLLVELAETGRRLYGR